LAGWKILAIIFRKKWKLDNHNLHLQGAVLVEKPQCGLGCKVGEGIVQKFGKVFDQDFY
jgi:hypothetical protein